MAVLHITVDPNSYLFAGHELSDLKKVLLETDRHTLITPVANLTDLCLNEEGKTGNGYAYTIGALNQLCGIVAPGLAQLVADVCGQWRKQNQDARIYSGQLAVEVLNRVIRLRFDRKLSNLQLVRNTKTKTIDGIVGAKYRYLSNSDFLERVDQECTNHGGKFIEACLYGRHFVIRYVNSKDPKPYTIVDEPYNFGYHFANSEIGGKSVRAATILVRCNTGHSALCPFASGTGGRVVHSGRDFEKRLHALMGHIIQKLPAKIALSAGGVLLEDKSLRLGDSDQEKRIRHLMQVLTRRRLTQQFARRVVSSAASKGRYDEDGLVDALPMGQRETLEGRTGYDLFVALIREAASLPIDQRETAEQVAYALLTGKIGF
jgi:hypothetical protein